LKSYIDTLKEFLSFLGPTVTRLLAGAITIGIFWFLVDVSFVLVLQIFLVSMDLVDVHKLNLPSWAPVNPSGSALLLVIFAGLRGIVWALKHFFASSTSHAFVRIQREFILKLGLTSPESASGPELITAFNDHILKAGHSLFYLSHFAVALTSLLFFSVYAAYIAPVEFAISFLLIAAIAFPIKAFDRKIKILAKAINDERSSVSRTLMNGIRNNFFLKISGMVNSEVQRGTDSLQRSESHYRKFEKIASIRSAVPICIGGAIIGLIYYLSSHYLHTSSAHLLTFFYLLLRIAQSVSELTSSGGEVQINAVGFRSLIDLSKKSIKPQAALEFLENKISKPKIQKIELQDLAFGYKEDLIFKNINAQLARGDTLLIVGTSGSGKSTLMAVIAGLLPPNKGQVLVNGNSNAPLITQLSSDIAYVGPEAYLIPESIRNNLLYGHPSPSAVTDGKIWNLLLQMNLEETIKQLPNQLDEVLHDQAQLSTGQKQRLSLVRALLREPQLLLLDEATANLDQPTESAILKELKPKMSDMITVIISHKNSFDSITSKVINLT
jgi:ABC-type multidrug transport system fused ATPase/permease subunit